MTRGGAKSDLTKWNLIGGIQFKHVKNTRICFFFLIFFLFIFFILKIFFFNKSKRIAFVSNLSGASNKVFTTNL